MRYIKIAIFLSILLIVNSCKEYTEQNKLVDQLNKHIIKLPNNQALTFNNDILDKITDWGSHEVIGLGEATHGTKNFFELKHRLFKYLVEKHNFKVLAYEFNFKNSLKINEYVCGADYNLRDLFKGELWIQDNQEVLNLISWMREYNNTKTVEEKIHFVGIDSQLDAYRLDELVDILHKYLPGFKDKHPTLCGFIKSLEYKKYRGMTKNEYLKRKKYILELYEAVKDFNSQSYNKSYNAQIAIHIIETTLRSHEFLFTYVSTGENLRDYFLSLNTLWIKELFSKETKIAVWAHNAHIAINPSYYKNGGASLGKYLRDELGEKYLSIASCFTLGEFKAVMLDSLGRDTEPLDCIISQPPPKGSINAILSEAYDKNFVLNIRNIKPGYSLYQHFDTLRPMIGIGDLYLGKAELHFTNDRILNLIQAHDLLFHFNNTKSINILTRDN